MSCSGGIALVPAREALRPNRFDPNRSDVREGLDAQVVRGGSGSDADSEIDLQSGLLTFGRKARMELEHERLRCHGLGAVDLDFVVTLGRGRVGNSSMAAAKRARTAAAMRASRIPYQHHEPKIHVVRRPCGV